MNILKKIFAIPLIFITATEITATTVETEKVRKVKLYARDLHANAQLTDFVKFSWGENKDKNSIILNKLEFTGVVPDVTTKLGLVIPGEIEGKQVVVASQAFSNLKADKIRLYIWFSDEKRRDVILPRDCSSLFKGSSAIYKIEFWDIKSDQVKDMRDMFNGCQNLSELDLRNFYLGDVKINNMIGMFLGCKNLKEVNLASWASLYNIDELVRRAAIYAMFNGGTSAWNDQSMQAFWFTGDAKKINILPFYPSKAEHLEKTLTTAQVGEVQSSELPFGKGNHNQTIDGDHSDKKSLKTKIEGQSLKEKETLHPQEQDADKCTESHINKQPLPNEKDKVDINSGEKEDLTVMQKQPSKSMIIMKMPEKERAAGYITKERREEIIPKKKQSSSICYITKALQAKPTKLPVPENARFTKSFVIRSEQKSGEGLNGGDISNRQKDQSIINEQNAKNPALVDEKKIGSNLNSQQSLREELNITQQKSEPHRKVNDQNVIAEKSIHDFRSELNQIYWEAECSQREDQIRYNDFYKALGYQDNGKYSWILGTYYEESRARVIGKAIGDCVAGKNEFERKVAGDIIKFEETLPEEYKQKNWNAVILYNYVHEAINGNDLPEKKKSYRKGISNVKEVLKNKLKGIKDYYIDYYEKHIKNDNKKLNRLLNSLEGNLNNAVNYIQEYVDALKLNEYLYEFKKIKLAYKKKKSIENLAPYLDDSSSSSSEVVEVWTSLVLTDKKDTNKSYLFYPTIAYDNNQLYIVELSRTVQRWEKSNKQGSMEQISIDSSKIKDLDGLKDKSKLLLERLDGLVKLPTEELLEAWHLEEEVK